MAKVNILFAKDLMGNVVYNNPTQHLIDYMASQGVEMKDDPFIPKGEESNESVVEEQVINNDIQPDALVTNIENNNMVTNQEQVVETVPQVEVVENVIVSDESNNSSDNDNVVPGVVETLEIFEF